MLFSFSQNGSSDRVKSSLTFVFAIARTQQTTLSRWAYTIIISPFRHHLQLAQMCWSLWVSSYLVSSTCGAISYNKAYQCRCIHLR